MSSNKNILIACCYPITIERIGGMDYFFWEIDKRLSDLGFKVHWLFASNGNTQHYLDRGVNFDLVNDLSTFEEELLVWLKTFENISLFVGHFLDYQSSVVKTIKNELGRNLPCIYIDHLSRPMVRKKKYIRFKKRIKGIVYYNQIDKIIAVSNFVKKSILNEMGFFWNSKIQVIYNGLKTDNYVIQTKQQNASILSIFCIGHLIKEKGFQTVINCCKILQDQGVSFYLIIAGDGNYRTFLEDKANRVLKTNSFTFLGNINNQSDYLNQADIVIIPSLWEEAFGFTNVEAMLMKKVIFSSNVGGIPEIVNDSEMLFEPNDHFQLARLIRNYISNKQQYEAKANKLYEFAQDNFTIEKMVKNHLQCYLSFLTK